MDTLVENCLKTASGKKDAKDKQNNPLLSRNSSKDIKALSFSSFDEIFLYLLSFIELNFAKMYL